MAREGNGTAEKTPGLALFVGRLLAVILLFHELHLHVAHRAETALFGDVAAFGALVHDL